AGQSRMELQPPPDKGGLPPAQLVQVVKIGECTFNVFRAHSFKIDLAVAGNAAPQIPDTAARRLTQVLEVDAKARTQIRLVADTMIELAYIVPHRARAGGICLAPLASGHGESHDELRPFRLLQ